MGEQENELFSFMQRLFGGAKPGFAIHKSKIHQETGYF
jgi:hypothetical protein